MRLCVLHPSYEQSSSPLKEVDPVQDPSRLIPEHTWERSFIHKGTAVQTVRQLAGRGYDAFVNMCDGAWEEDVAGVEVAIELERLGVAYTGPSPQFFEPSRQVIKLICHRIGVDTPRHAFVARIADAERAASSLRFPMIVKHPNSYCSIGMTRSSRVEKREQLLERVEQMLAQYGEALIEEFIDGPEFTALVAEPGLNESTPRAYPPVEILFPEGESFKHFDLKWSDYAQMGTRRVSDAALELRLQQLGQRVFAALKGVSYARLDVRMGPDGRLHLLDVNPSCGVFYPPGQFGSADIILSNDPGGQRGFLEHIIACALRRQEARRPRIRIEYGHPGGYGLAAAKDLAEGECILAGEGRPHSLMSWRHVERTWADGQREALSRWSHPLSEGVLAGGLESPEEWSVINHSCEPNAWLNGLDFVARRPIREGEPITIDYATLYGPTMAEFTCECGSQGCRGTIRGTDHLEPWVEARYGDHVSPYVKQARKRA
ncbi:SET domain-containing protein-lysine N-methyltransferase [Hyalangium versicolor]|uniref:SET domain-containing protein-lysine N-methyltransferase n=1 Tax=Hyalangium versicolor TaxID=2861190 RepID=UPI001CC98FBA|nr:SET domain-containing protein-lysine N-methyltransferase [Hyalangium versicolor]